MDRAKDADNLVEADRNGTRSLAPARDPEEVAAVARAEEEIVRS